MNTPGSTHFKETASSMKSKQLSLVMQIVTEHMYIHHKTKTNPQSQSFHVFSTAVCSDKKDHYCFISNVVKAFHGKQAQKSFCAATIPVELEK